MFAASIQLWLNGGVVRECNQPRLAAWWDRKAKCPKPGIRRGCELWSHIWPRAPLLLQMRRISSAKCQSPIWDYFELNDLVQIAATVFKGTENCCALIIHLNIIRPKWLWRHRLWFYVATGNEGSEATTSRNEPKPGGQNIPPGEAADCKTNSM